MLKKIGLVLLVVIGLLALVSAFLPGKIHVERSTEINAAPKKVFDQVNNLTKWQYWSYWDQIDPNMKSEYEGPESGAGAVHKWWSENDSVGNGTLTIVESNEPSSITTSLNFENWGTSMGGWNFEETDSGTRATIYMDVELPFLGRIFPGIMMDEWMGKDFDKTLAGLKKYVEELPDQPEWNIETVTTNQAHAMSMRVVCKYPEMQAKMGETYGMIQAAMAKQGLSQAGHVFAIYHHWAPPDTVDFEPGIVVNKPGKNEGKVTAIELPPVKAVRLDYYGDYSGLGAAHGYIETWMQKNNATIAGAPWEEYVTDPGAEPDTAKWLTRVYYPIQ
jgi:effector-binding domain-containing protein